MTAVLQSTYLKNFGKEATEEIIERDRKYHINRTNEATIKGFISGHNLLVDRLGREFELLYTHEAYSDNMSITMRNSDDHITQSWNESLALAGKGEIDKATPQVKYVIKEESVTYDFRETNVVSQLADLLIQAQQPTIILVRMGSIHHGVINKFDQTLLERARRLLLERILESCMTRKAIPEDIMNAFSHFIGHGIKDEVVESLLRGYPELGSTETFHKIIELYETSA